LPAFLAPLLPVFLCPLACPLCRPNAYLSCLPAFSASFLPVFFNSLSFFLRPLACLFRPPCQARQQWQMKQTEDSGDWEPPAGKQISRVDLLQISAQCELLALNILLGKLYRIYTLYSPHNRRRRYTVQMVQTLINMSI
jgi:hypothetical protein